jgi:hypothetical protein
VARCDQPNPNTLNGVAMASAAEGWAVGAEGTILHYFEGKWETVSSPTSESLYSVATVSTSDEGWAVGASGTILHYSGGQWQMAASPTSNTHWDVMAVSLVNSWRSVLEGQSCTTAIAFNVTRIHIESDLGLVNTTVMKICEVDDASRMHQ